MAREIAINEPQPGPLYIMPPEPALLERMDGPVLLQGEDHAALEAALRAFPALVCGLEYSGPLARVPRAELLEGRQLIISLRDLRELVEHFHLLPKSGLSARIAPGHEDFALLKTAASLKLPLDLLPGLGRWSLDDLMRALALYLFEKSQEAPIEPFHSIFQRLLCGQEVDLWAMAGIGPERYIYLDRQGNAALCPEHLGAGRFLGSLDQGREAWQQSPAYRELMAYHRDLPSSNPDCLACRFYAWCRGWSRYGQRTGAPDSLAACRACVALGDRLLEAYGELSRLREQLAQQGMLQAGGSEETA